MDAQGPDLPIVRDHRRQWRDCRYVYPVVSRRSRGLSIGININPDKACNFYCLYCQVDRRTRRDFHDVNLALLRQELRAVTAEAVSGRIWQDERFAATPPQMQRVNDFAFSGDGEPTRVNDFDRAVALAAQVKSKAGLDDAKLIVISNASQFDQPQFGRALPILDVSNGEIWAKLDAGTEQLFERVNRPYPRITLNHILRNITAVAKGRPIVIQTLFFRLDGIGPPSHEIEAYCHNVREILAAGGRIKLIQLHTIARAPTSGHAAALGNDELDAIAADVRAALPGVPTEVFYGHDVAPQQ